MKGSWLGLTVAILSLLTLSGTAFAGKVGNKFSLTPRVGRYNFAGSQDINDTTSFGLSAALQVRKRIAIEGSFDLMDTDFKPVDVGVKGYLFRLEGIYSFPNKTRFTPFLAAGVGGIDLDYSVGGSDSGFLFDYGGGLAYSLSDRLSIRGDLRHIIAYSNTLNNFLFSIGLTVNLGGKEKARVPERSDSDSDGVYDEFDKCPDTPAGEKVDSRGCPPPLKTPISMRLDIAFEKNSAEVRAVYHEILRKVADFMTGHPDTEAVIEGHTDSRGSDSYNMTLSEKRAQSVMKYLADSFGIEPSRLKAIGYGERRPIADNRTEEGRRQNRRVKIVISSPEANR